MPINQQLRELQEPEKLNDAIKEQQKDFDCLPCRLMGSAAFTALGIYTYGSGMKQLRQREKDILKSGTRIGMSARRGGIWGMSALLVGMGVYRLVN